MTYFSVQFASCNYFLTFQGLRMRPKVVSLGCHKVEGLKI